MARAVRRPRVRASSLAGLLGLLAALSLAACDRGPAAKPADHVTAATLIGVVTSFDFVDCRPGRFHLDTGQVVDLPTGNCADTLHVREMFRGGYFSVPGADARAPIVDGPLMLFGEDGLGYVLLFYEGNTIFDFD